MVDPYLGEYKISALFRHLPPTSSPSISRSGPRELPSGELRLVISSVALTQLRSLTILEDGNVRDEIVIRDGKR